jgi:hypothetical protein
VVLSPDRFARNYAHQWLLIEEFIDIQVCFWKSRRPV